jgi:hypothetical protein
MGTIPAKLLNWTNILCIVYYFWELPDDSIIRMRLIRTENSVTKFRKTTKSVFMIDVDPNIIEISAS